MSKWDKLRYERPCGKAFLEYGTDLNVAKFGDRLCLIDDWIVLTRVRMAKLEERVKELEGKK